jgi:hypothetical protein
MSFCFQFRWQYFRYNAKNPGFIRTENLRNAVEYCQLFHYQTKNFVTWNSITFIFRLRTFRWRTQKMADI